MSLDKAIEVIPVGNTFYICPLCGQEFRLKTRQKNVKCGDHTLRVCEADGLLTIQVVKQPENVLKGAK